MSYTFSRRDFMKYTALTAVAVAGSSLLTGCSNPNQPTGKVGDRLKVIGYHTLQTVEKNSDSTYTFTFKHEPNSDIKLDATCYALSFGGNEYRVSDLGKGTITKFELGDGESVGNLTRDKTQIVHLTIGVNAEALADVETFTIRYWPRSFALGTNTDAYNNVYASWVCTIADIADADEDNTEESGS